MAAGNNDSGNFEAGMRRYWDAWNQAMQGPAGTAPTGDFPWRESIEQWTRLISTDTPPEIQELGARFQYQAGDWLGTMQQVAARFAGRDTSAAEVAGAWREAVQGQGDGLLQWMLGAAGGGSALNDQPWLRDFARAAQTGFGGEWMNAPAFGPAREHQARWQALLKMQRDYQGRADAYVETIRNVLDDAFKRFEAKLAEHETPGSQLTSARAMFDLWIDAAEEAYAKVALSEDFQRIYADLANAQMRLRAASQQELERACTTMGMPTRTEMDTAHRRITELERQVRRLIAATAVPATPAAPTPARPASAKPKAQSKAKPAAKKKVETASKETLKTKSGKSVTRPAPKPVSKPAARKTARSGGKA